MWICAKSSLKNPTVLRRSKKNADRWYDAKQEVELIEIMDYTTTNTATLKRTIEESWQSTVHDRVKKIRTAPAPRGKAKAAPKAQLGDGDSEAIEIPPKKAAISAAQTAWFVKNLLDKQSAPHKPINELKDALAEFRKESNRVWSQFIPLHIIQRSEAALLGFEAAVDDLSTAKESGDGSNFKDLQKAFKDASAGCSQWLKKVNVQWGEAWEMLSEEEQARILDAEEAEEKEGSN